MRLIVVLLVSMGLWACVAVVPEPEATEVGSGTSTVDSAFPIPLASMQSLYSEGILATHKLVSKIVQVDINHVKRVRYLGLPDGVAPELGEAMNAVCESNGGKNLADVREDYRLEVRKLNVYFNCR